MPYMPPELLAHSQLTPLADVYSFGMVMWEIYTGQVRTRLGRLFRHMHPLSVALHRRAYYSRLTRTLLGHHGELVLRLCQPGSHLLMHAYHKHTASACRHCERA